MNISDTSFHERATRGIDNEFMRTAVASAQERMGVGRLKAAEDLGDWETWRSLGEEIRKHTIDHLDYYLHVLSDVVAERGGHVFFAATVVEANVYIVLFVRKKQGVKVVKYKIMVS